jgi:hypothetical protein
MTKSALGEAGLKRKAQELEAAQTENDRPIPSNMITDFPISDVSPDSDCARPHPANVASL